MKKAILVVSFGTSYKETRQKTIEACEKKIQTTFSDYKLYSAYTSDKIIQKISMREGIEVQNPIQALEQLHEEQYEEVIIQPLYIINGKEFDELAKQVHTYQTKFKNIFLGEPLLSPKQNYDEVVKAIKYQLPVVNANEAIVFMGHGTLKNSNECYKRLESHLKLKESMLILQRLKGSLAYMKLPSLQSTDTTTIHLVPLMLVAGYHVVKDMIGESASSWKNILEREGFKVKVDLKALGENPKIQDLFVQSAFNVINILMDK